MLVVRSAVVGPFAENTYLVACDRTGEAILVDPGGEHQRVWGLLEPGGFQVRRIVCTHGHIDHVAGAAEARRQSGAPVQIHADDRVWLSRLAEQAEMFGFEDAGAVEAQQLHADGEVFAVGEHRVQVIHTPGHSQGGCCLFFSGDQLLFSGDTLFAGSVGRTDLPGGDFAQLDRSIREKLFPLGDSVRFYPGHGPEGLLGEERRSNPFVGQRSRHR
jgi:hydroxyacylglutathione hydrolase